MQGLTEKEKTMLRWVLDTFRDTGGGMALKGKSQYNAYKRLAQKVDCIYVCHWGGAYSVRVKSNIEHSINRWTGEHLALL